MGTHIYTHMATKNIAITEDAYELLLRNKHPGESFSQVIREHFKKKKHLIDYAGIWADIPSKEWDEITNKVSSVKKELGRSIKKKVEGINR